MSGPEQPGPGAEAPAGPEPRAPSGGGRHEFSPLHGVAGSPGARYAGMLALLVVVLAIVFAFVQHPAGVSELAPGDRLAPFAVPLATGSLRGAANVATHAHEGAAGNVPACSVRKAGVLNICALYERSPVVLALFVDGGSCPHVLARMQALAPSFPGVRFAAVAIEGNTSEFDSVRTRVRALVRAERLTLPVGIDADGALATLYKVVSCPQVSFAYPGGVLQSRPLLVEPSASTLRARVAALVAGARARGWREPAP